MRFALTLLLLSVSAVASAAGPGVIVTTTTTITSAQADAETMARSGVLRHCGRAGGMREGVGFSTRGPTEAERACCFYQDAVRGRYKIVERGVAYSPARRGWFAVLRYAD